MMEMRGQRCAFGLALVFVVIARWSIDLFVIFITFRTLCTLMMSINRSVEFKKKKYIKFLMLV
jgi:hypothetical protein